MVDQGNQSGKEQVAFYKESQLQYRPKVSYHRRARRKSRRALQESLRALQESRRARWQKICKYSGLTLVRDFNYPLI